MAPPPARSPAKKSPQQTNLLCPVGPARHGGPAFHRSAACSNKKRPARQEPAPFGLREPSSRFSVATLLPIFPPITSPETMISTRRFSLRPAAVLLSATGLACPSPFEVMVPAESP